MPVIAPGGERARCALVAGHPGGCDPFAGWLDTHALLPDEVVKYLGRGAGAALAAADRGEDPRPYALAVVQAHIRTYEGGDRPPSPPAILLRFDRDLRTYAK